MRITTRYLFLALVAILLYGGAIAIMDWMIQPSFRTNAENWYRD